MKKFINEVAYSTLLIMLKGRKVILKHILNTRGGFFVAGIILSVSSIIILHEGKAPLDYIRVGLSYTKTVEIVRASDELSPQEGAVGLYKSNLAEDTGALANELTASEPIEVLIARQFKDDAKIALAVAKSESNLNPLAHNKNSNGTIDTGIFQINSIHGYDEKFLQDPENNIKVAYEVYLKAGKKFTPWVVYNNQSYLNNL